MRIFTSYHAKTDALRKEGLVVVNISRNPPSYRAPNSQVDFKDLAPQSWMLKLDRARYDVEFDKILKALSPEDVMARLEKISNGKDIALVCYEKNIKECHRETVALWLQEKLGVEVTEYVFQAAEKPTAKEAKKKPPTLPLLTLF